MGILNVTPDSFSDGGNFNESLERALTHAMDMVQQGADVIDVGGESTRPGAKEVLEEEEMERVLPVIRALAAALPASVLISIDTRHAAVAEAALEAGAHIVNDVSGATFDPSMIPVLARQRAPAILMHMRGTPETMQSPPNLAYGTGSIHSVVETVSQELKERVRSCLRAGIPRWMITVDPGIGFAKNQDQNLALLRPQSLRMIRNRLYGSPILVGASRKGFIGKLAKEPVASRRDSGTTATSCAAAVGGAYMVRVHNVEAAKQALAIMDAILIPPSHYTHPPMEN